ncbi:MAG: metal-dependent transcriptional regulator [Candidatus Krumholzibacteriia bacterium]
MDQTDREAVEDLLEAVWLRHEAGLTFALARYASRQAGPGTDAVARKLVDEGLLSLAEGRATLTATGEEQAASVVRRHRLAERLYTDLLQGHEAGQQSFACRFEHILSEEVTAAVCTLLGHPPTCPHGRRIPPGDCCRRAAREVRPLVRPLSEFPPGAAVRIVFLAPSFHQRLDRLSSFGVLPGAIVHLHQKHPACVLRVGATEVALEREVAGEIYGIGVD